LKKTCAEKGEAHALKHLSESILIEHQVVLEAARDPVFWRILATKPEFPQDPSRVAAALRWYGAGAAEPGTTPA